MTERVTKAELRHKEIMEKLEKIEIELKNSEDRNNHLLEEINSKIEKDRTNQIAINLMNFGIIFAILGLTFLISDGVMIAPFSNPNTFVNFSNTLLVYGFIALIVGLIFVFGSRRMSLFFNRKK